MALFEMSVVEQRYQAVLMVLSGARVVDVAARFGTRSKVRKPELPRVPRPHR